MRKEKGHIHFVGIGGIGASSLARYFLAEEHTVSGSDVVLCSNLEKEGVKVFEGHSASNVPPNTVLLIYSAAVSPENEEVVRAKKDGIEVKSYPEALGEITKRYYTITVSGTHGKSTTTAMLALIMIEAGLDPTVIIGTKMKELANTNFRKGESKYLLIEADEFGAALLNYYPEIAIVTNIEEDHLDFYRDINHILSTFEKFVRDNLKEGLLVVNEDDKNADSLRNKAKGKVEKYTQDQKEAKDIVLSVPGRHNISNALAAFTVAKSMGIKKEIIIKALSNFKGTWRRLDEKDAILINGKRVKIINDYAHHPTEIKVTLEAIREKYPTEKVLAVFQPHQYERTHRLFPDFVKVLSEVNVGKLIITDIYTVEGRESKEIIEKVSSELLCKNVDKAICTGSVRNTGKYLLENLQGNEILVIMGAGDVYSLEGYITGSPFKGLKNKN